MSDVEKYIREHLENAVAAREALYACSIHGIATIIEKPGLEHVEPMIGWCVLCGETTGPDQRR